MRAIIGLVALLWAVALQAASPVLESSTTSAARGASSLTVTLPMHSEGDGLVIFVSHGSTSDTSDLNAVSGWSKAEFSVASNVQLALLWKTAGASEADPVVSPSSGGTTYEFAARAMRITGWDGQTPSFDAGTFTGSGDTTYTAPTLTPTEDALVLRALARGNGNTGQITSTPDTLVGTHNSGSTTNGDVSLSVTQKDLAGGVASGTADFTADTGERAVAGTVLLEAAAAGGSAIAPITMHLRRQMQ